MIITEKQKDEYEIYLKETFPEVEGIKLTILKEEYKSFEYMLMISIDIDNITLNVPVISEDELDLRPKIKLIVEQTTFLYKANTVNNWYEKDFLIYQIHSIITLDTKEKISFKESQNIREYVSNIFNIKNKGREMFLKIYDYKKLEILS